jgi:predicted dehydrogenase
MKKFTMGIIGCGDFLRIETANLNASKRIKVKSLFDTDINRAKKYAAPLGGTAVDSMDAIFNDPAIDLVGIFVPPWARKNVLISAVKAGKNIIATKPLGPTVEDCRAMVRAVENSKVRCGIIYNRTGNSTIETAKSLFDSGKIGRLALVRHDWIHHYPQWNNWALDPSKNGGPFTDAEIHNLNFTRYLMGRKAAYCTFFSDNLAHPKLPCPDTECMKLDFENNGTAHLFITWAADLKVDSLEGNFREHIDVTYLVTDQGWRVTFEGGHVVASKNGQIKKFPSKPFKATLFDRFAESIEKGRPNPRDLPMIREAYEDIKIIRTGEAHKNNRVALNLS